MQKLRIGLTKRQYQTLVQLSEGLERARRAAPYRKYRPNLTSYKGHYKEWWLFAYTSVLEETVRRYRRNWDWNHMRRHRDACRTYAESYKTKLTTKKLVKEMEERLTDCEKKLDIFNLVIIREQIQMEVERLAEREKNLKAKRGWFDFLWGSSQSEETKELNSAAAIMRRFDFQVQCFSFSVLVYYYNLNITLTILKCILNIIILHQIRGSNDTAGEGKTVPGDRLSRKYCSCALSGNLRNDRHAFRSAWSANLAIRYGERASVYLGLAVTQRTINFQIATICQCNFYYCFY